MAAAEIKSASLRKSLKQSEMAREVVKQYDGRYLSNKEWKDLYRSATAMRDYHSHGKKKTYHATKSTKSAHYQTVPKTVIMHEIETSFD